MALKPIVQHIKVAVDAVNFTVRDGELMVLLVEMTKKPFTGKWAFPGGLIDDDERAAEAVRRILKESTGLEHAYLEQLATFDDPGRDPVGRVVSIAYFALMPSEAVTLRTGEKYADARWHPVAKLPRLAYDHDNIAAVALARIQARLGYTNIVWSLLPAEFTLADIHEKYEAILQKKIDRRNFVKKILTLGILSPTGKMRRGAFRPAALYRFKTRKLEFIDIL